MALWFKKKESNADSRSKVIEQESAGDQPSDVSSDVSSQTPETTPPAVDPLASEPTPAMNDREQEGGAGQSITPLVAAVSSEQIPLGVKTVLKPVQAQPKIQVADKSNVLPPKTEPVAADQQVVARSDPKILYYQLMNGLYDVIYVLDDDGHIIDCNTRSEEVFGYSADDVWNMPIEKIVFGMNTRMFSLLKQNLTNKRHTLIDARCFRSTGTSFRGEIGVSTLQLTRTQNVVFAIRNTERRKNSAEELRKYRAVMELSPMLAFACDLNGRFEMVNPPVLKALGVVDEMEAQRKHFWEILPEMRDRFQAAVLGEDVHEKKEAKRPDGSIGSMELYLSPMRKGDEIAGVAGIMTFS